MQEYIEFKYTKNQYIHSFIVFILTEKIVRIKVNAKEQFVPLTQ